MAKFISDFLDKYSQATVGNKNWAFLDCMTKEEQLKVIKGYGDLKKYIVVVFERNDEEIGLNNSVDESDYGPNTEEMEE